MSGPRMNVSQMNGNSRNNRPPPVNRVPPTNEKPTSAQHEELIRFINESWNQVTQELDKNNAKYHLEQESPNLKDFEPFDLEGYWGRRVVHQSQHS